MSEREPSADRDPRPGQARGSHRAPARTPQSATGPQKYPFRPPSTPGPAATPATPGAPGTHTLANFGLPADFRAFHQLYRAGYIRYAELHLESRADAEEAVDLAFEQLMLAWQTVLRQPVPEAYAWRVVKNRTIDHARARGRRPVVVDVAAFETLSLRHALDPISELEESLTLYQTLASLPERQRDVMLLRYALGYATKETARLMGITEAGVRSTIRYALRRLRQAFDLEEGEDDARLAD
ncbi:sigma-70 family RNA polymerase sigma factor [Streptomyces rimosus]|uniref:RNA polymerase sigma factor n=1 Tax=Streptomyces rimosus TaxID=1927 RepID=UPI0009984F8E|nr:sigma-70 family RNA polymerase sigma factor [Streptomyces rimosus]